MGSPLDEDSESSAEETDSSSGAAPAALDPALDAEAADHQASS